jgi:hypothetical protein
MSQILRRWSQMQIKDETYPETIFENFAKKHDLVLVIKERPVVRGLSRYYAYFENTELMENGCLVGAFGNGQTKDDAISDYARRILGYRLVVNASSKTDRREIQCPNEWSQ